MCIYPHAAINPVLGPESHFIEPIGRFGFFVSWASFDTAQTFFYGTWAFTEGP